MRLVLFSLLIAFLFSSALQAQNPYERVDSIMRAYNQKVNNEDDLWRLSYFIRHTFTEDSLRLRAAFIWITENIEYDIKAFQMEDTRAGQLSYVLKKKKAICGGYAALLQYFCDTYKIEGYVVEGRGRSTRNDVYITNTRFASNHAWNAVKINGQWRLLDATWAAGVVADEDEREDIEKLKYRRSFEEFYYFTPPDRFALTHYPKNILYSYVPKLPLYKEFVQSPFFTTQFVKSSVQAVSPNVVLLEAKVGDTLTFHFQSKDPVLKVSFWSKRDKANFAAFTETSGDWYEAKYPVTVSGFYELTLGFNDERYGSVVYQLRISSKY